MPDDPQQTRRLLVARIIEHLQAQQVDLCEQLRVVRSTIASPPIDPSVYRASGWHISTAPAPPTAYCVPTRLVSTGSPSLEEPLRPLVERPLSRPTRRNYNYFTELDEKLATLMGELQRPWAEEARLAVAWERGDAVAEERADGDHGAVAVADRPSA
jgi:hypothetical protein